MSMITIKRDESKLEVRIESRMGYVYCHEVDYKVNAYAHLIKHQLDRELADKLESIRREAYNEVWKDAKSKKVAKRARFKSWW